MSNGGNMNPIKKYTLLTLATLFCLNGSLLQASEPSHGLFSSLWSFVSQNKATTIIGSCLVGGLIWQNYRINNLEKQNYADNYANNKRFKTLEDKNKDLSIYINNIHAISFYMYKVHRNDSEKINGEIEKLKKDLPGEINYLGREMDKVVSRVNSLETQRGITSILPIQNSNNNQFDKRNLSQQKQEGS